MPENLLQKNLSGCLAKNCLVIAKMAINAHLINDLNDITKDLTLVVEKLILFFNTGNCSL